MTFVPFDDNQTPPQINHPTGSSKQNYDTSTFDKFRQGVEMTLPQHLLGSSEPKLWDGNPDLSHQREDITYGQAQDFVEGNPFGLGAAFEDLPEFNPVAFIVLGPNYPLPIVFNDGPMESGEAQIEPLTIPFKIQPTTEGPYYIHQFHGNLDEGNNSDNLNRDGGFIVQFIPYTPAPVTRYFLDQGGGKFGTAIIPQFVAIDVQKLIIPYDDTKSLAIVQQLTNQSASFQTAIAPLQINLKTDLRPNGNRSAPAGYSYYNPGSPGSPPGGIQYGTDSIAFGGWALGS